MRFRRSGLTANVILLAQKNLRESVRPEMRRRRRRRRQCDVQFKRGKSIEPNARERSQIQIGYQLGKNRFGFVRAECSRSTVIVPSSSTRIRFGLKQVRNTV